MISGLAKGHNLKAPAGNSTRPTTDRIKETIFNVINFRLNDAKVLDLFAGSGSLGIEALSRGAANCVFCDLKHSTARLVKENVEHCKLADKAKVVSADYIKLLERFADEGEKFDVIFLDPPYYTGMLQSAANLISELDLLEEGGTIVAEFPFDEEFSSPGYTVEKIGEYGKINVAYLRND